MRSSSRRFIRVLTLLPIIANGAGAQTSPTYPPTRKDSTVDNYFGTRVADPYRWLEDQNSTAVAGWVDAQNKVTFDYLAAIPLRATFKKELTTLINVPRVSTPFRIAGRLYYSRNSGLQNQPVVLEQIGKDPSQLVLDPNLRWPDGSTELSSYVPSPNGKYLAYSLSVGGSDCRTVPTPRAGAASHSRRGNTLPAS